MSTTTRAKYLAMGGAIGLVLAVSGPAGAAQPQGPEGIVVAQAGTGDEPHPRAKQQKPKNDKQQPQGKAPPKKEGHQRGQKDEPKHRAKALPKDESKPQAKGEPRHKPKPEPKAKAQHEQRDNQNNKLQKAREQKQDDAKRKRDVAQDGKQRERAERERKDREGAKRERGDRERAESERKDRDRANRERGDREKADRDRADRERAEREKAERERGDRDRADREKAERERNREKAERERKQENRAERREDNRDRKERRREVREERRGSIDEVRRGRKERREGDRIIIEEPGNRRIIRDGNRTIIRHDDSDRFRRRARDVNVESRNGERVTTITRPNGDRIITIEDSDGRLLRRMRRNREGREIVLIDNTRHHRHRDDHRDRHDHDRHHDHGGGALSIFLDLAMPRVEIDRHHYIVDAGDASEDYLYETLIAPPVVEIERDYSLDEVRYNYPLRARMRSVNLNTINFEFGSWEVDDQAFDQLGEVARAIKRALDRNPDEIFLIEGHTDAVGSDDDNLTLADRRAETVAIILSDEFEVPPENLTTQGYGEQYLVVDTQEPERQNRRVTVRRITPLLSGGPR